MPTVFQQLVKYIGGEDDPEQIEMGFTDTNGGDLPFFALLHDGFGYI